MGLLGMAAGLLITGISLLIFIKLLPESEYSYGHFLRKKVIYTSIALIVLAFYAVYLYIIRYC